MPTETQYIQLSVRITPAMDQQITTLMSQNRQYKSKNEFVRACIRAYLDETGDFLGSRRHFNKQMGERLDQLEAQLIWQLLVLQQLVVQGNLTILAKLSPEVDPAAAWVPSEQFHHAQQLSQNYLVEHLATQERTITQLSEHLRKRRATKVDQAKKTPPTE